MIIMMPEDLFKTTCKIIALPVNCMGDVDPRLKEKYPGSANIYTSVCQSAIENDSEQDLLGNNLACVTGSKKIIVNMFVKHQEEIDPYALRACLADLKEIAEKHRVFEVALEYGLGLDKIQWRMAYDLLESIYGSNLVTCRLYGDGWKL